MKVAIIGGGITGLAAAYYLQKEILAKNLDMEYRLFESGECLGGKIQTDYYNDFVIEKGPDSFLARKESATKLAKEVGLTDELISNSTGQAYVLKDKQLHPIPPGAVMGIPTKLGPFLTTDLFSVFGKVRAGADLILPKGHAKSDQSLGIFFRRRLGSEVVDNLIEPLLSGIYAGNIDRLSLQSTFPQFQQVEENHRSLILGMMASRSSDTSKEKSKKAGGFLTLRNGLQSFVEAIENHLDEDAVHKSTPVRKITRVDDQYQLQFNNGEVKRFDKVIITTPHHVSAEILEEEEVKNLLHSIPSTSVATIGMAFDENKISGDFDGTGFVVSKKSDYTITACTWTHRKWPHAAPSGKALLRCFVGKPGDEGIVERTDEEIVNIALKDLNQVMKVEGQPEYSSVTRWRNAMPQYEVGHQDKMQQIKDKVDTLYPGIYIAGNAFEGVGLPDCIGQGEKMVKQLLASY